MVVVHGSSLRLVNVRVTVVILGVVYGGGGVIFEVVNVVFNWCYGCNTTDRKLATIFED